eukprot:7114600-Prymnesium_polylepis.1
MFLTVVMLLSATTHAVVLHSSARLQSPRAPRPSCCEPFRFSDVSFETLRGEQRQFVEERDWAQFHTPRSLALALVGEVGELCELLQWRGDDGAKPGLADWSAQERTRVAEELSDVLSYVMRLADVCEIDLPAAALEKLAANRAKYPADQVRGSSAKYTEYRRAAAPAVAEPQEETPPFKGREEEPEPSVSNGLEDELGLMGGGER